ncbi:PhzF family phenazine biosynthesis protein [Saonia flava]|uniref:PhzF family phenazine biosynthesis protein n=1 Tax=Saonia flava TaxID=523696 RepID=A0A846QYC7_9FLAO|nr:PhzF family phenazine biosynthesis protein [Saonia flava]NJB70124.1 PhzF family phenazine biosynthesis protein [Saonia flava]
MKKNKVKVQILNAFVDNDKGGNPAGVVLDADHLSNKDKLEIARKVGLSETAFVSTSKSADFKLDFFTPTKQIAHCGHATVATFSYLRQLGSVRAIKSSKETIDGRREINFDGDLAFMQQTAPKYKNVSDQKDLVLESLKIKNSDLVPNTSIEIVNTGNSFIIVPVKDAEVLKNITPEFDLINKISEEFDLIGFYVFTNNTENLKRDASARMFGPRYGIIEEAGTGMAAGPLACYLFDKLEINKERLLIQQGEYMETPSPSLIIVDLKVEDNSIISLMAGGKGIVKSNMEIEL